VAWKKALEVLSYLLVFGLVYKIFIQRKVSTEDVRAELDEVDIKTSIDLSASEEVFEAEIEEIESEEAKIKHLDRDALAREFDSEF
tara:strand:- start:3343 stop:3600 length:258 start_codon:yes stop_codon:yes gene_type:complete